ncbi:MAG: RhuM family protein, partial [Leifsonia sp.]
MDEVEIYQSADGTVTLDVKTDGDTVWLTQAQLVDLFRSSKANISEHIKNIFEEGELSEDATVRDSRTVRPEGTRSVARTVQQYNLDLIISLGYRVKSGVATQFRI